MNHFKGKSALKHVIDARLKGKMATAEIHGIELVGHISAAADAAKETAFLILGISFLGTIPSIILIAFVMPGWLVWKTGRSAILGWSRLERMHRVIEEEKWEIEHHRPQEKEELRALYQAKGFSGKLLDEVVEVLMADDNRLLQLMLEEELGLTLESQEHPLKQAAGAFVGVLVSVLIMSIEIFSIPEGSTPYISATLLIAFFSALTAKLQGNSRVTAVFWNLGVAAFALGVMRFIRQLL
jgi:hypothetical protein